MPVNTAIQLTLVNFDRKSPQNTNKVVCKRNLKSVTIVSAQHLSVKYIYVRVCVLIHYFLFQNITSTKLQHETYILPPLSNYVYTAHGYEQKLSII